MRRPAVSAAAAFGAGIVTAYHVDISILIWMIILTAVLIISIYDYLHTGKCKLMEIIVCMMLLGGVWLEAEELRPDPLTEMYGEKTEVEGVVKQLARKENMYSMVLETGESKVLVKYYTEDPLGEDCCGDVIRVSGTMEQPQGRRNPGCFDYSLYLRSCGIQTILKADKIEMTDMPGIRYLQYSSRIKSTFEERLAGSTDQDTAGMVMAIMFGDKDMLDSDTYSDFQKNGTAHVLAVSGLHTGILYAFFAMIWRGKKGAAFHICTFVILFMYMSLADFSPSVVRAACMIFLHLAAGLLRCRYDLLTAAGVTFMTMLIIEPFQIFHVGFQLSFLAIISLGIILPFVDRFYKGVFLPAVAIQAGMVPYTAYVFNYVSAGAFLANIPVIFLAGIILPLGLCDLAAAFMPCGLFGFLTEVLELACDLLVWINGLFYASGRTSFDVTSPPVWLMIVYYGIVFFALSETGQILFMRREWKRLLSGAAAVVVFAGFSIPVMRSPLAGSEITFVDVGQGDCIHVHTAEGRNYLIDGGGSTDYDTGMKVLKPYLLKNGVKHIDTAFVTHLHEDHYGGIRSLSADGMIKNIAVYEANICKEELIKTETDSKIIYLRRGHRICLGENIFLEVISPEAGTLSAYENMITNEEDENKSSLIFRLEYKGRTVLITGDIDEDGENELIRKYGSELDCDIMKVPHHGSKYSSCADFIEAVSPEMAVFQVGRNNYGHPAQESLERYEEAGCIIARNDQDGAIGISIEDDGNMKVIKMIH